MYLLIKINIGIKKGKNQQRKMSQMTNYFDVTMIGFNIFKLFFYFFLNSCSEYFMRQVS